MTILLLFFCSGATALIYEVLWSKYLTLLFGSTVQAQTVVLAIFMGGLALGNRLFGARADRLAQPIAVYGYLEGAIGLYAFFFGSIYKGADVLFCVAGAKLLAHSGWLLCLKAILSAALLLGPTILMGGTLPLLAAWLQRRTPDAGRRAARFYSTNSLGAVCGAGLAGFFLVTWLGMPSTLQLTGLVNVFIGITAIAIARSQPVVTATVAAQEKPDCTVDNGKHGAAVFRSACLLVAVTGGVSMGLEVLASRCLSMMFGASLQAFAIVLMAFILGIGLGSAVIASRHGKAWSTSLTAVVLLLGAAAWVALVVYNIEFLAATYMHARTGLNSSAMGYRFNQLIAAVFSIFVLGIPAGAIGAVLPLCIRIVAESSNLLGDRVGRLLTWNTLGCVVGVLITGFVLMPHVGLRGSLVSLALILGLAAFLVSWRLRRRVASLAAAAVCGLLVLVTSTGSDNWRRVLSCGMFRFRGAELSPELLKTWFTSARIVFYEDAADATVSVEENASGSQNQLGLRVNGKPDASTGRDLCTQLLCAHLPLMVKSDSKDVFVLGVGSGVTAGAVLGYPVERLTVAENCEPVLRAARYFDQWNRGVLTNARTHICTEDARTVLKLSPVQYDVIIAEPSNPWTVGIGSVFSREFYELAASRLKPDGIMVQWFHVYEMNDGIVSLVLRTFGSVFPEMEIWDACGGDILILGAKNSWVANPSVFAAAYKLSQPRSDLESIGLPTPESVLIRQLASQRTAPAIAGPGPIQTDDFPVLEYVAPEAFFIGKRAQVLAQFDERTWHADLAPLEKSHRLANLGWTNVIAALGLQYPSVNADLDALVMQRSRAQSGKTFERFAGGFEPPCIFESTNDCTLKAPPGAQTNSVVRALFEAELALSSQARPVPETIQKVEDVLMSIAVPKPEGLPCRVEYYAALAAKARLRTGDAQKALQIVERGLQLAPKSENLLFLKRVMAREGLLGNPESPLKIASAQQAN